MSTEDVGRAAALTVALLVGAAALGQPPPAQGSPDGDVSPADLEAIQRALEQDQAGRKRDAPPPAPTGPGGFLQSFNPDLSFIGDVALAVFSDEDNLQTGGHDPTRTGFNLQQLELAVGAAVDPYFRFDGNLVFALAGVEIEEAYATTLALPYGLQVRAGQFLTRFGRQNPTHPHSWTFSDQPFALGRVFGGEGNRGLGVEGSWLAPTPWYVELVVSATEARGEGTAKSFFGGSDLPVTSPLDFQLTLALKQFFALSDDWSLLVGASAANGPNATGHDNRTDLYGADLFLKHRPLTGTGDRVVTFQAELLMRRRQVPHDLLSDVSGYAQLAYHPDRHLGYALRYEYGSPSYGRDGRRRPDDLDPDWSEDRHRFTGAVSYWPTEFSRLRLQASMDAPGWRPDPVYAAFLTLEFSAGAHGAHKY